MFCYKNPLKHKPKIIVVSFNSSTIGNVHPCQKNVKDVQHLSLKKKRGDGRQGRSPSCGFRGRGWGRDRVGRTEVKLHVVRVVSSSPLFMFKYHNISKECAYSSAKDMSTMLCCLLSPPPLYTGSFISTFKTLRYNCLTQLLHIFIFCHYKMV